MTDYKKDKENLAMALTGTTDSMTPLERVTAFCSGVRDLEVFSG